MYRKILEGSCLGSLSDSDLAASCCRTFLVPFLSIAFALLAQTSAHAQLSGSEQQISKQIYTGNFYVNGDKDTYYPVVFKYGDPNQVNHLRVFRSYNEAGPNELHATHKGGLSLEIDVNYGGWGGFEYGWRIMDLRQWYHTTFAGAYPAMHNMGFVVWLRGGGFLYHYESEKPSYLQVAYSTSELIYDHSNNGYDVYAPAPKSTPDDALINAHWNGHWDNIKDSVSAATFWEDQGSKLVYDGGNVGIGTNTPSHKLEVNGSIRSKEVIVEAQPWPDYVFEDGYALRPLSEVEAHIAAHGRLPGMPPAVEVAESGVSIGESQRSLLEKVEELTLYMIEKDKQIEALRIESEKRIKGLEADLEMLRTQIEAIR